MLFCPLVIALLNTGEKLSLSERSLICIARALLSSVDILLLSNALDLFLDHDFQVEHAFLLQTAI